MYIDKDEAEEIMKLFVGAFSEGLHMDQELLEKIVRHYPEFKIKYSWLGYE
jgi:hypothetical protein